MSDILIEGATIIAHVDPGDSATPFMVDILTSLPGAHIPSPDQEGIITRRLAPDLQYAGTVLLEELLESAGIPHHVDCHAA